MKEELGFYCIKMYVNQYLMLLRKLKRGIRSSAGLPFLSIYKKQLSFAIN